MKAVVQRAYGPPAEVLELREVETPIPGDGEVLVRVRAASVHPDVWHVVTGLPYALRLMGSGARRPTFAIPGTDVAGVVEATGTSVARFKPGDAVFGECVRGHQWQNGGAYAEYVCVLEAALAHKPPQVTFEQAAAVPTSGLIALYSLRDDGELRAGHRVLINGAGGGVGSVAVQIAKAFGAHVTAVDRADKLELMRSLGADRALDYAVVDFTRAGERYDLVLDIPGNHSLSACLRAVAPSGKYVLVGHDMFGANVGRWFGTMRRALALVALSTVVRRLPGWRGPPSEPGILVLQQLMAAGQLAPPIDRTFTLAQVPAALLYLAEGAPRGKVVVVV